MKPIDVLILCGGRGTRLQSVVNDRPKPMAEVQGRPFLDILIDYVLTFEVGRIILCTGHGNDYIYKYYENKIPTQIILSPEHEPLGTAGALRNAEWLIQTDKFLVLNGDTYCPVDLHQLDFFHTMRQAAVSVVASFTKNTADYDRIYVDDYNKITHFRERFATAKHALVNAGMYLMNKEVLASIPVTPYSLENDLFPRLVGDRFFAFITFEKLLDIGTPERYAMAQHYKFKEGL